MMEYNRWITSVPKKREKYKNSPQANSLLLPQHRRCRRRRLMEVLLSRPPLGDLSSPKEVDEPRSLKKRSGRLISGRSCKGTTLRPDSLPSSSGRRIATPTSSSQRAPQRRHRTCAGVLPSVFVLGCPGPCRAHLRP